MKLGTNLNSLAGVGGSTMNMGRYWRPMTDDEASNRPTDPGSPDARLNDIQPCSPGLILEFRSMHGFQVQLWDRIGTVNKAHQRYSLAHGNRHDYYQFMREVVFDFSVQSRWKEDRDRQPLLVGLLKLMLFLAEDPTPPAFAEAGPQPADWAHRAARAVASAKMIAATRFGREEFFRQLLIHGGSTVEWEFRKNPRLDSEVLSAWTLDGHPTVAGFANSDPRLT